MLLFAMRRLLLSIPLLIGITFISFLVISLAPGGPLDFLTPEDPNASAEVKQRLIQEFGLDQPVLRPVLAAGSRAWCAWISAARSCPTASQCSPRSASGCRSRSC